MLTNPMIWILFINSFLLLATLKKVMDLNNKLIEQDLSLSIIYQNLLTYDKFVNFEEDIKSSISGLQRANGSNKFSEVSIQKDLIVIKDYLKTAHNDAVTRRWQDSDSIEVSLRGIKDDIRAVAFLMEDLIDKSDQLR